MVLRKKERQFKCFFVRERIHDRRNMQISILLRPDLNVSQDFFPGSV